MRLSPQKLCLPLLLLAFTGVKAQSNWPSPELEQMYKHAEDYLALRNYPDAIVTFKQAILLAPANSLLYRELGKALYLSGDFSEATQTLSAIMNQPHADTALYVLLAKSQYAQNESKRALETLKKGIEMFPRSGLLYHEAGEIYSRQYKNKDALSEWLTGISKDPAYPSNYKEAALSYMAQKQITLGLLCAETYLDLPHDTTGDDSLKEMTFSGWKKMFGQLVPDDVTNFGKTRKVKATTEFVTLVHQVFIPLTPVISDGITAENLTMVRTRFLMDWFRTYGDKYPFSLFTYQQELICNGKFEIYNEWLFGKAENQAQYEAWNKFHEGDISRFLKWKESHPLRPVQTDFYNDLQGK